jgi:hypothetical protein
VRVSLVEPGAVRSEFIANARLDIPAMVAEAGDYGPVLEAYLDRTMNSFASSSAQTPAEAAAVIVNILIDPEPTLRGQTSEWARTFAGSKLADLDGSAVLGMTRSWVTTT